MADAVSPKPTRSAAITIVGWLLLIGALLNIIFGALLFWASEVDLAHPPPIFASLESDEIFTETGAMLAESLTYLLLGIVQLVLTVGFWRIKRWAWVAAMSWQALKLLIEISDYLATRNVVVLSLVSAIIIVFLLNQSDVRRAFGILRREHEPPPNPPLNALDVN